jgi:hypothetical protein
MRMPKQPLPARGFSAEYFPRFHGARQRDEPWPAIVPPRKNSDAAAWVGSARIRCRDFAAGSPQRYRKTLTWTNISCKRLSLIAITSKSLASGRGLAAAFHRSAATRVSESA